MTGNLSQQSCDLGLEREVPIQDEKCSNATEIDRWEEILQVEIQNISSPAVIRCVINDRSVALESMREFIFETPCLIDFLYAVLQDVR
jgi:hypothetical protein